MGANSSCTRFAYSSDPNLLTPSTSPSPTFPTLPSEAQHSTMLSHGTPAGLLRMSNSNSTDPRTRRLEWHRVKNPWDAQALAWTSAAQRTRTSPSKLPTFTAISNCLLFNNCAMKPFFFSDAAAPLSDYPRNGIGSFIRVQNAEICKFKRAPVFDVSAICVPTIMSMCCVLDASESFATTEVILVLHRHICFVMQIALANVVSMDDCW